MFYQIDTYEDLLTVDLVGEITVDAVLALVEKIRQDPRYSSAMPVLHDLSRGDLSGMSSARIRRLTSLIDPAGENSRLAIYAPDDLAYGLARIYVSEASLSSDRPRQVFKNYHDAISWLSSGDNDTRETFGGP